MVPAFWNTAFVDSLQSQHISTDRMRHDFVARANSQIHGAY